MDVLLHQTFTQAASSRHCYSNVKSRIDQTDQDPAHTFSHSITELPIKEDRQTKPGSTNTQTAGVSSGTAEPNLRRGREPSPPRTRVQRSAGTKSPYTRVKQQSELISREKVPSVRKGLVGGGTVSRKADSNNDNGADESNPGSVKKDEDEDEGVVISAEVRSRAVNSKAFEEESEIAIVNEENMELNSRIGVCGMEVMSNSSGTTVVLKHILPLGGNEGDQETSSSFFPSNLTSNMTIVEEDKHEEFYESEDTDSPSSEISSSYILPHLIPQLYVTDEDNDFVEIVVDKARKLDGHVASYSDVHRQEIA